MKILQLTNHLNIGGITRYIYTLSKYLLKEGIEVGVASRGGSEEKKFEKLGAKIFKLPLTTKNELSFKSLLCLFKLLKIKKKEFNFDLIHSHTRLTQFIAQNFMIFFNTPHVTTFHGFYEKNKRKIFRKIFKCAGRIAIAITPQTKDELIRFFKVRKERIKVIVNGIDLEEFSPHNVQPLELEGDPKIGSCGRLSRVKGYEYLLKGFKLLLDKYPSAKLYLLGEGKDESRLLNLASQLNIQKNFEILKGLDVKRFLKSLDVFCYPSIEEPFGLAVLEAQSLGVPCVVSKVGGLKYLVKDKITGQVVEPACAEKIFEAIDFILSNKDLKESMSIEAQKFVRENFDFSKKISEFIKVYREVLKD